MRCSFCVYWREDGGAGSEMGLTEMSRMLDGAKDAGVAVYSMTGGEPLLRRDAPEILAAARERGLFSMVITNGLLLERCMEDLRKSADLVVISIDSLDPGTYGRIRGRASWLDEVLAGLKTTAEAYRDGRGPRLVINCVLCDLNVDDAEDIASLARRLGVGVSFEPVLVQATGECPALTRDVRLVGRMLLDIRERYDNVRNSGVYLRSLASGKRPRCMSDAVIRVGPDGTVTGPCMDHPRRRKLGNVNGRGLAGILASDGWKDCVRMGRECAREDCWMACYMEPALLLSHPLAALSEAGGTFRRG